MAGGRLRFEVPALLNDSGFWELEWTAELTLYDETGRTLRTLTMPWNIA